MSNQEPSPDCEPPSVKEDVESLLKLGRDIVKQANSQIENHLSKTVDGFKTHELDSWQELYESVLDKYGSKAVQWKDAAMKTIEGGVANLAEPVSENWNCFGSYAEVEEHLQSLNRDVVETEIRNWVMEGKSWIVVREGKIYVDPKYANKE